MFHLFLRTDAHVSLVPTSWHRCFTCPYVLTQMFHLSLCPDTDVSLVPTSWHSCFSCPYVLTHVSLVPTSWHRCFACPYVLTQMFRLSLRPDAHVTLVPTSWHMFRLYLRSDTDVSLVLTFLQRCYTCTYVLTQMLHLSLRSDRCFICPTFWHRCFTCHQVLASMFPRQSLISHTCCFTCSHALALILFHVTMLQIQAAKHPSEKKSIYRVLSHTSVQNTKVCTGAQRSFRNIKDLPTLKMATSSSDISVKIYQFTDLIKTAILQYERILISP
jgi:hypothetical protein